MRAAMHGSIVGLQHGPKSLSLEGSACNNLLLTPVLPQDQPLVSAGSSGQLSGLFAGVAAFVWPLPYDSQVKAPRGLDRGQNIGISK
jgi:hypothetical protein